MPGGDTATAAEFECAVKLASNITTASNRPTTASGAGSVEVLFCVCAGGVFGGLVSNPSVEANDLTVGGRRRQ